MPWMWRMENLQEVTRSDGPPCPIETGIQRSLRAGNRSDSHHRNGFEQRWVMVTGGRNRRQRAVGIKLTIGHVLVYEDLTAVGYMPTADIART